MIRISYGNLSRHADVNMLYTTDTPAYAARIKFILMNIIGACLPSPFVSSQLLSVTQSLLPSGRSTSLPAGDCFAVASYSRRATRTRLASSESRGAPSTSREASSSNRAWYRWQTVHDAAATASPFAQRVRRRLRVAY